MSTKPTKPASTQPPTEAPPPPPAAKPPPAPQDELDLAGAVDQLLADIDAAGSSLVQDLAADAPAPVDALPPEAVAPPSTDQPLNQATDAAPPEAEAPPAVEELPAPVADTPAAVESAAPETATAPAEAAPEAPPTHEALLAELDSLLQEANNVVEAPVQSEPVPPSAVAPTVTEAPAAESPVPEPIAPVVQAAPAPVQPTPPVATIPAAAAESISALDEEVCRLADRMLEQPAGIETALPKPASVAAAHPLSPPPNAPPSKPAPLEPEPSVSKRRKVEFGRAFAGLASKASPLFVKALTPLSAPLAGKPAAVRQSVGWIACSTVFFSAVLWGVVLTRKPATVAHEDGVFDFKEGDPPQLPIVVAEEPHAQKPSSEHGEASSEHGGEAAKSDAHGGSKAKPPAKKPPRKNRVASKGKKPPPPPSEHE